MFTFDPKFQVLTSGLGNLRMNRFPETVTIQGKTSIVEFYRDNEAATCNEFWDGEAMQYCSNETGVKVFLHRFD
jgi:hypothetical protein